MDTRKAKREQRAREMYASRKASGNNLTNEKEEQVQPIEIDLSYVDVFNEPVLDKATTISFRNIPENSEEIFLNLEEISDNLDLEFSFSDASPNNQSAFGFEEQPVSANGATKIEYKEEPLSFNNELDGFNFPEFSFNDSVAGFPLVHTQEDAQASSESNGLKRKIRKESDNSSDAVAEDNSSSYEEPPQKKIKVEPKHTKSKATLFQPNDNDRTTGIIITSNAPTIEFMTFDVDNNGVLKSSGKK